MAGAPTAAAVPAAVGAPRIVIANVVTMDPERPTAEAFAVLGDTILAVGALDEVRAAAPGAVEEALEGTVLPGLIDAHLHMERGGLKAMDQVEPGLPLDEFIAAILAVARGGDWTAAEPPTIEQRVQGIELLQSYLHQLGFTGIVDPAAKIEEIRGYQEAHRRGRLTMRVVAMPYPELPSERVPDAAAVISHLEAFGASTGFGDDTLRLGPIKIYFDGEGMKGEALLERPWNEGEAEAAPFRGVQRIDDADFAAIVDWCAGNGWGVGVHAVGGGAVAKILDVFAAADAAHGIEDLRFQIIHAYLETPMRAIAQAAQHHVIASLQPSLIWNNAAGLRARLGERVERANPVRSWLDAGATVAFGSDGPWFVFDPRHNVWQAVTREVKDSTPPLDAGEAITAAEGFAAYTRGAAYAALAEHRRGMIRAGLLADWALWSADPTTAPIEGLRAIEVLRTEVGGRTVFRRG